jgi:predicted kinase
MPMLTVVGGLPGSGKSRWLKQLEQDNPALAHVIEDYKKDSIGHRPEMIYSRHYADIVQALRDGRDCVIADVVFVDESKRNEIEDVIRVKVPGVEIRWVVYEDDWRQCIRNLIDGDPDDQHCLKRIAKVLELRAQHSVPKGIEARPVYKPNG